MSNHISQSNPPGRSLRLVALVVLTLSLPASADTNQTGKHLFILSGQSTMTSAVKDAFADRVRQRFSEENAVVVSAKNFIFRVGFPKYLGSDIPARNKGLHDDNT